MKKSERISVFVEQLGTDSSLTLDPHYQGYFTLFNAQQYYEAHDVLEDLWLRTTDENYRFFKGLIQLAGAFVHLQKQFEHPTHAKHGRRLRPAVRLFDLSAANLAPFRPQHLQFDVAEACELCRVQAAAVINSDFLRNPWSPAMAPQLVLLPE
ncbi:MAG: hypothetical protein JWQ44_1512 [Chthoniobacter sp.]|jgi:hypothetical protein|nr:hypothetical protein [Chthoniobacter sp.]